MKQQTIIIRRKKFFLSKHALIILLLFANMLVAPAHVFCQAVAQDTSSSIVIHQEANFTVAPQQVYEALLSSKKFSASTKKSFPNFSDTSAKIKPVVGGTFSLFDGHIIGRVLELVPNQRIVEAWRVVDWPAGAYSIATFELAPQNRGTHLVFEHIGFPNGLKEHLADGWQQHYWDALNKYFK